MQTAIAPLMLAISSAAVADLSEVPSGTYSLDSTHGYITISYSHLGFSNPHVGFDSFDVTLEFDSKNPAHSEIDVDIDATSIDSRVEKFNDHLNSGDFFETAKYPDITFKSTQITKTGADDTFEVTGDLTIKGKSVPVTLVAEINKAAIHPMRKVPTIGVSAQGKVNRSDWGLDRNVPYVGDEVTIMIEVELLQAKEE
jgi:polyisoprenoid-binding protein YceI